MTPDALARRALAIDLDGTLMDSMQFHARAWQEAFQAFQLDAPLDWFLLWEGVRGPEVIARALALLDAERSADEQQQILALKRARFEALHEPMPLPGLAALTATLQDLRYPVAVVTGSEHQVAARGLERIGFAEVVRVIVGSDDVMNGKPAPDPYLQAARALGVNPAHALVLENAPVGVDSAKAASIPCIAVTTTLPYHAIQHADYVLPGLEDFSELLRREHRLSGGVGAWQFDQLLPARF